MFLHVESPCSLKRQVSAVLLTETLQRMTEDADLFIPFVAQTKNSKLWELCDKKPKHIFFLVGMRVFSDEFASISFIPCSRFQILLRSHLTLNFQAVWLPTSTSFTPLISKTPLSTLKPHLIYSQFSDKVPFSHMHAYHFQPGDL